MACPANAMRPMANVTISLRLAPRPSYKVLVSHLTGRGASAVTGPLVWAQDRSRRFQSSSSSSRGPSNDSQSQQPPPSTGQILRAVGQVLDFRPLFKAFRAQNFRSVFRRSPEEFVFAIIVLAGSAGAVVYAVYLYFNYFQSKQFTRFPPSVAKSLRRALYYSNYSPDPPMALKYYKMALEQCEQLGLDQFSDEVMGIKIQLAAWLEKIGSYQNAVEILEAVLRDNKRWVEVMEKSAKGGLIDKAGRLKGAPVPAPKPKPEKEPEEPVEPENLWGKRTRILGKSVGISVKLGELYADEHILEADVAGERLIWAVETVLKELHRRQAEGVQEGEGDWMTPEQIGGALEALGNHYESKSQHYLAAPLFLQALQLSPPDSCHTAVLMNNLAISLAQQPLEPPVDASTPVSSKSPGGSKPRAPAATRATLLASARSWALQAEATTTKISGENRTPECDEACAVALSNLGDIALMSGDVEEAKRRFDQCLAMSRKITFAPGIAQAQEGLKRASEKTTSA